MGMTVSVTEQAALKLLCELAQKYDCKLKEKDAATVCQWARRRGHLKQLKDVFWQPTWRNIGADLWGSVQDGQPEACKLAPIYGTMNKVMPGLHGEVEAKRAMRQALGIADEDEEEGEDRFRRMRRLTEDPFPSRGSAPPGKDETFDHRRQWWRQEQQHCPGPPAAHPQAAASLSYRSSAAATSTYLCVTQPRSLSTQTPGEGERSTASQKQQAARRKTRSRVRSRGGQAGALKARGGRPAAQSPPPAPRRAWQDRRIARALRPPANLASPRPSHRAPRLPAARQSSRNRREVAGWWMAAPKARTQRKKHLQLQAK